MIINLTSVKTPVTQDLAAVLQDRAFPLEFNGPEGRRVRLRSSFMSCTCILLVLED